MWINKVIFNNLRGFTSPVDLELSRGINLLVGPNNSGKSTIIKTIYSLQNSVCLQNDDISKKRQSLNIFLHFEGAKPNQVIQGVPSTSGVVTLKYTKGKSPTKNVNISNSNHPFTHFVDNEPNNIILPFLSKRKVNKISHEVKTEFANKVFDNFNNLYPKIDRIANSTHPKYDEYTKLCVDILGMTLTCVSSPEGRHAGLVLDEHDFVPIDAMGEGVASLAWLIVNLCTAENKVILLEEPENDIHPKALKSLLELILKKSNNNQLVISTHSNIVVRYLGSEASTKIFKTGLKIDKETRFPITTVKCLDNTVDNRMQIMGELGYELVDFQLWNSFLLLEESSAEKIIREFLIPQFAPGLLGKVKTIAAGGLEDVEPRFIDFHRLFVFIHSSKIYKNKAWVVVDGGEKGNNVIRRLKEKYSSWDEEHFIALSKTDFEYYYPDEFRGEVDQVLSIQDKQKKRESKIELLSKVESFLSENEARAREELSKSAKEVISILKSIETVLGAI